MLTSETTKSVEWPEARREFVRMVAQKGVPWALATVPVSRATIYRIMRNDTTPHKVVQTVIIQAVSQKRLSD